MSVSSLVVPSRTVSGARKPTSAELFGNALRSARPKSDSTASPEGRNSTLPGVTPPCTTPTACAAASAVASDSPSASASTADSGPNDSIRSGSDCAASSIRTAHRSSCVITRSATSTGAAARNGMSLPNSASSSVRTERPILSGYTFSAKASPVTWATPASTLATGPSASGTSSPSERPESATLTVSRRFRRAIHVPPASRSPPHRRNGSARWAATAACCSGNSTQGVTDPADGQHDLRLTELAAQLSDHHIQHVRRRGHQLVPRRGDQILAPDRRATSGDQLVQHRELLRGQRQLALAPPRLVLGHVHHQVAVSEHRVRHHTRVGPPAHAAHPGQQLVHRERLQQVVVRDRQPRDAIRHGVPRGQEQHGHRPPGAPPLMHV